MNFVDHWKKSLENVGHQWSGSVEGDWERVGILPLSGLLGAVRDMSFHHNLYAY